MSLPEIDPPNRHGHLESSRQMLLAVTDGLDELNQTIIRSVGSLSLMEPQLDWVAPTIDNPDSNYRDAGLLKILGRRDLMPRLSNFWPREGPFWGAVAKVGTETGPGILLVETKSSIDELFEAPSTATSTDSTDSNHEAMVRTKRWLGIDPDINWVGPSFPTAARLAHLYFFREIARVPAWFVTLCFVDAPGSPTSTEEWCLALTEQRRRLGFDVARAQVHAGMGTAFLIASP